MRFRFGHMQGQPLETYIHAFSAATEHLLFQEAHNLYSVASEYWTQTLLGVEVAASPRSILAYRMQRCMAVNLHDVRASAATYRKHGACRYPLYFCCRRRPNSCA